MLAKPYGHVIKVIQPLSQPSKDVRRFHAAASQPRVAITGQLKKLNKQSTFCKEKETSSRSYGQALIPISGQWQHFHPKIANSSTQSSQRPPQSVIINSE